MFCRDAYFEKNVSHLLLCIYPQHKLVRLLPAQHVAIFGATSRSAYQLTRDEAVWEVWMSSMQKVTVYA